MQEQLDDTVYKPTESLWNRIDQEVNRPEFEKRVEGKVGNYQLKPYPETWEQIEAQLPPERKNRRRVGLVWFSSLVTLLVIAFGVGSQLNYLNQTKLLVASNPNTASVDKVVSQPKFVAKNAETKKVDHIKSAVDVKQTKVVQSQTQPKNAVKRVVKAQVSEVPKTPTKLNNQPTEQATNMVAALANQANPNEPLAKKTLIEKAVDSMEKVVSKQLTTDSLLVAINADTTPKQIARSLPAILDSNNVSAVPDEASKLSLTILVGAHYSMMQLQEPNASLSNTVALRKNVEQTKVDWSGGFLLDYALSKNWMVSSGIQFTHFSMGMNFGTATTSTAPKYEPGGTFLTTDSVTTGVLNNQRIKYSWNEIPLMFTYKFKPSTRLAVEAKVGVSYAIISVVDVAMVAQNNIGVLSIKSTDAFPGFNNSWFAQTYLGLSYRLNDNITLTAMPYVKYSINNMIERSSWISQRPCMVGLSFGLRKQF